VCARTDVCARISACARNNTYAQSKAKSPMDDIRPEVDIQITPPLATKLDVQWLRKVAEVTLQYEGIARETHMTLVITDDQRIQELNRQFRDTDAPTDVLAFAFEEGEDFVTPSDLPAYLGDVIISYPRAVEQAVQEGHSTKDELALLVVHGILHLLGYDDKEEEKRTQMWKQQDNIMKQLTPSNHL